MTAPYICVSCRTTMRHPRLPMGGSDLNISQQTSSRLLIAAARRSFSANHQLAAQHSGPSMKTKPESVPEKHPYHDPSSPPTAHMVRAMKLQLENEPPQRSGPFDRLARQLRKRAGTTTETYVAFGACERLARECGRQADYSMPESQGKKNVDIPKNKDGEDIGEGDGWWYQSLGIPPTFSSWAQVTFLHMYMLTCRFRMFPPDIARPWHQHLINQFSYLAEDRMTLTHGIAASSIRSRYLKDLFLQWRGLTIGYDEGLFKGDAVLATAIWRNIFKAADDVDFRHVVQITEYMKHGLKALELVDRETIETGGIVFNDPGTGKGPISVARRGPRVTADPTKKPLP